MDIIQQRIAFQQRQVYDRLFSFDEYSATQNYDPN
jgi:hypothetical protein